MEKVLLDFTVMLFLLFLFLNLSCCSCGTGCVSSGGGNTLLIQTCWEDQTLCVFELMSSSAKYFHVNEQGDVKYSLLSVLTQLRKTLNARSSCLI